MPAPTLNQIVPGASAATVANGNFRAVAPASIYGYNEALSSGLTWAYWGGTFDAANNVAAGTIVVGASTTTYVVGLRATGAVSSSTSNTNWNNSTTYFRIARLVSNATGITTNEDNRPSPYGVASGGGGGSGSFIGLTDVPAAYTGAGGKNVKVNAGETALVFRGGVNAQTGTTYTPVVADEDAIVTMTNAAANVLTVPPNSSVAFPLGTTIAIQQGGAGATSVAAGVGVTITPSPGMSLVLSGQEATAVLYKEGTNAWTLLGELAPTLPVFANRAWANFNGVTTVTVRGSGNCSSITRSATGVFRFNFLTPMPNANYAIFITGEASGALFGVGGDAAVARTTTYFEMRFFSTAFALTDPTYANVTVVG